MQPTTHVYKFVECRSENGSREFNLTVHGRVVATVCPNGTWHTWDHDGCGGENDVSNSLGQALYEAAGAAFLQGFTDVRKVN